MCEIVIYIYKWCDCWSRRFRRRWTPTRTRTRQCPRRWRPRPARRCTRSRCSSKRLSTTRSSTSSRRRTAPTPTCSSYLRYSGANNKILPWSGFLLLLVLLFVFSMNNLQSIEHSISNLYIGETFTSYICLHNHSQQRVGELSVKVELQTVTQKVST